MATESEATERARRVADGTAWKEFCRALEACGEVILGPSTPDDAFDRAEGFRYLTRLVRASLESNVESSDPQFPRFFQLSNETVKIGNDNPDNVYHNANLSGAHDYRIHGRRGTTPYISWACYGGGYGEDGRMTPTGQLDSSQLEVEPDGSFEIVVSAKPQPNAKNWLAMDPSTTNMVVRQTFHVRADEEPARYAIECLNPTRDDRLDPASLALKLGAAASFVRGTSQLFVDWMRIFEKHVNQLPADDQTRCQNAGGDKNIHYKNSRWELGPDEALVIEAPEIPRCSTWNFQLGNFWMESLDYRYHRVSVNKYTAAYEPDGSVRVVVAHRDPGPKYPNWIDTCGHARGAMLWRWIEADSHPDVHTRVVKFAEL
ncbi:MAG: DUF1214 domain-containing protein [Myxococcota bacterium]